MPPGLSPSNMRSKPDMGAKLRKVLTRSLSAFGLAALTLTLLATSAQALPPTISGVMVSGVTTDSATLEAMINPQSKVTEYHFEYGAADCESSACTSIPSPKEGKVPVGSSPVPVSAEVNGLEPGTTYHYRLVVHHGASEFTESPDRLFAAYAEPPTFGSCSNHLFRTENPAAARIDSPSSNLPDCRAYEQATPVDKNAGDAAGTVPFARASLTGDAVGFVSTTGIPGGVGSQEFPSYFARRNGDAGWSTEGTLPPAGAGQTAQVLSWTPDFGAVFSKATRFGEPFEIELLMTPAGGAPIKIVDYFPEPPGGIGANFRLAGTSAGAAQVLFESRVALPGVAGALAGKPNLYLWDAASNELVLAGIQNDEQAPPAGAFSGSYDWIKGTTLAGLSKGGVSASYYTSEQHVISTDGSAVYFTAAGTGQLYLRLNPTQGQSELDQNGKCTQPADACTLRISTSQKSNGVLSGEDPAGPRPAAFMGASADGSVALFTSSEKLTNDANTGPEAEPAVIERAESDGSPESIRPSFIPTHALGVAVGGSHVYWVNPAEHTIGRATLEGGQIEEAYISTGPGTPQYVAVDGKYVYWSNLAENETVLEGDPGPVEGTIGRAEIGPSEGLHPKLDFITGASAPQGVVVDATHIYWVNAVNGATAGGKKSPHPSIGKANIDGTAVDQEFNTQFISSPPRALAIDDNYLYWDISPLPGGNCCGARFSREALAGGSPEVMGHIEGAIVTGLAVDGEHIYWTEEAGQGGRWIARADLDITPETPASIDREFIPSNGKPFGLAADGSYLFWSVNGDTPANPGNDLYRYAAGALEDISVDSSESEGADVQGVLGASEDGDFVYYAANGVPDSLINSTNAGGESAAPGDCNGAVGFSADGTCNLYLWHEGSSTFISRLDIAGGEIQSDSTDWAAKSSGIFNDDINFGKTARVTSDGRTLLFRSQRQLTDYENVGISQFYRYRVGDAGPTCVSCNPTGLPPTGNGPGFGRVFTSTVAPSGPNSTLSRNLSSDGNRVFFETTDALVVEDTNGDAGCPLVGSELQSYPACLDVYEWEADGTGSCAAGSAVAEGGCLFLISTGKAAGPALIGDASEDGGNLFFYTRARLVGQDEDQLMDVYDARAAGGLADQNRPPATPGCEAEGCKPLATPPPATDSPPQFEGPPNPPPKHRRCGSGKHLRKGHCVGRHPKRHKKRDGHRRQARAERTSER